MVASADSSDPRFDDFEDAVRACLERMQSEY
jgi:hypothetical protein